MSNQLDLTFDTPEPIELYVENGRGRVDVTATDTTETTVRITGERAEEFDVRDLADGRGSRSSPRRAPAASSARTPAPRSSSRSRSRAAWRPRSAAATWPRTAGSTTPASTPARATSRSTSSTASTVVQSGSGDVVAEHLAGDARIKSGSGDVRVDRADSDLLVTTGSGDVRVDGAGGELAIKTGSGDAMVGSLSGEVVFTTGSGDLVIGRGRAGPHHRQDRERRRPASASLAGTPVWTDVRTASGRLSSNLPSTGEPAADQPYLEVRATTASGDVTLHQS